MLQVETADGLTIRVVNNVSQRLDVKHHFSEAFRQEGYPDGFNYQQKVIEPLLDMDMVVSMLVHSGALACLQLEQSLLHLCQACFLPSNAQQIEHAMSAKLNAQPGPGPRLEVTARASRSDKRSLVR